MAAASSSSSSSSSAIPSWVNEMRRNFAPHALFLANEPQYYIDKLVHDSKLLKLTIDAIHAQTEPNPNWNTFWTGLFRDSLDDAEWLDEWMAACFQTHAAGALPPALICFLASPCCLSKRWFSSASVALVIPRLATHPTQLQHYVESAVDMERVGLGELARLAPHAVCTSIATLLKYGNWRAEARLAMRIFVDPEAKQPGLELVGLPDAVQQRFGRILARTAVQGSGTLRDHLASWPDARWTEPFWRGVLEESIFRGLPLDRLTYSSTICIVPFCLAMALGVATARTPWGVEFLTAPLAEANTYMPERRFEYYPFSVRPPTPQLAELPDFLRVLPVIRAQLGGGRRKSELDDKESVSGRPEGERKATLSSPPPPSPSSPLSSPSVSASPSPSPSGASAPASTGDIKAAPPASPTPAILVLIDTFSPVKGGITVFNITMCFALAERGHHVFCYVPSFTPAEFTYALQGGVHLVTPLFLKVLAPPSVDVLHAGFPVQPGFVIRAVIGHALITGPHAFAHAWAHQCKFVLINHVLPEMVDSMTALTEALEAKRKRKMDLLHDLNENAGLAFSVGPLMHQSFQRRSSVPWVQRELLPPLLMLPPPVSVPVRRTNFRVLAFGRVEPDTITTKGFDIIAKAAARQANQHIEGKRGEPWELTVRGIAGGALASTRALLAGMIEGGAQNLRILPEGYGSPEVVQADILNADVVVMPSRYEPFGLVGWEAIAVGRPVLISQASGLARMLLEHRDALEAIRVRDTIGSYSLAETITNMIIQTHLGTDVATVEATVSNWAAALARVESKQTEYHERARQLILVLRQWPALKASMDTFASLVMSADAALDFAVYSDAKLTDFNWAEWKAPEKPVVDSTIADFLAEEKKLRVLIEHKNLMEKSVTRSDGNCMFDALADQLPPIRGVSVVERSTRLRQTVAQAILAPGGRLVGLQHALTTTEKEALPRNGGHGNHVVLFAVANLMCRNIHIYSSRQALDGEEPTVVRPHLPDAQELANQQPPMLIGHRFETHYISLQRVRKPAE